MNTMTSDNAHCIATCNSLLRGELSAIETYGKVIDKFGATPEIKHLRRIRGEHTLSAARLREYVVGMNGTPDHDSGSWGSFATSLQSTADLFGEHTALWALRQGEEYGRGIYEAALEDQDVQPECKHMIRTELFPRLDRHVVSLDSLSESF